MIGGESDLKASLLMARVAVVIVGLGLLLGWPASSGSIAAPVFFSTGNPDGRMALGSRPAASGVEIEAGDDFALSEPTSLTGASFTGLLPSSASLSTVQQVVVEIYRVFPLDSDLSRTSGAPLFSTAQVPTRVNSPSDVDFAVRDTTTGSASFTAAVVSASLTTNNSILNGINPKPNQTTGGDGAVTGEEVDFNVALLSPISLPAGHYFFVPQVRLSTGNFFWLSAPDPIVAPGTPFPAGSTDLQAWIRNADLAPDWLRAGTDIVGGGPPPVFNAAFSLSGATCPTSISISPASLPDATVGSEYAATLAGAGGASPYSFTVTGGLPGGLSLSPSGRLSGIPTQTGSFPVSVTATDSNGCQGSANLSLNVVASSPTRGGTGAGTGTPPAITFAHLSDSVFRAAGRGPMLARARRAPIGTTVGYRLSAAAITTFAVLRIVTGHQKGHACLAGRPIKHQKRCTRRVSVGTFTHQDAGGEVRVRFNGRVRSRKLDPARYLLLLTPRANGQTGRAVELAFRIAK